MHRILNLEFDSKSRKISIDKPDVRVMDVHGITVLFDCNSLCSVCMDTPVDDVKEGLSKLGVFTSYMNSRLKPQFNLHANNPLKHLVLNVTHKCNQDCTYCFASSYPERSTMTTDIAESAIDLFPKGSHAKISFFGGEPLVAKDVVDHVMAYCKRKHGENCSFHITTNGTLITPEIARWMVTNNVSLLVSLDGPKAIHDKVRLMDSGGGSFDLAMAGIENLKAAGRKNLMIRATYSSTPSGLVERLKFFKELKDKGLIRAVSIEPAILSEGCAKGGTYDMKELKREYHEAAKWFASQINQDDPFDFFHFKKFLGLILFSRPKGTECGAGNAYLTVGPTGDMFACHREGGTKIGSLKDGPDTELRSHWRDNRVYMNKTCMSCWARYLCGGGCRQSSIELGGDIRARGHEQCKITKMIFEECFWIATQVSRDRLKRFMGNGLGRTRGKR